MDEVGQDVQVEFKSSIYDMLAVKSNPIIEFVMPA